MFGKDYRALRKTCFMLAAAALAGGLVTAGVDASTGGEKTAQSVQSAKHVRPAVVRGHFIHQARPEGSANVAAHGRRGPRGPRGPAGPPRTFSYAVGPQRSVGPNSGDQVILTCPEGQAITGGENNDSFLIALNASHPAPTSNSWTIEITNFSSSLIHTWIPYVICVH